MLINECVIGAYTDMPQIIPTEKNEEVSMYHGRVDCDENVDLAGIKIKIYSIKVYERMVILGNVRSITSYVSNCLKEVYTDEQGYFKFNGYFDQNVVVEIDESTLPDGFELSNSHMTYLNYYMYYTYKSEIENKREYVLKNNQFVLYSVAHSTQIVADYLLQNLIFDGWTSEDFSINMISSFKLEKMTNIGISIDEVTEVTKTIVFEKSQLQITKRFKFDTKYLFTYYD